MKKLLNITKNEMMDVLEGESQPIFFREPYELVTIHKKIAYKLPGAMPPHWEKDDQYKIVEV